MGFMGIFRKYYTPCPIMMKFEIIVHDTKVERLTREDFLLTSRFKMEGDLCFFRSYGQTPSNGQTDPPDENKENKSCVFELFHNFYRLSKLRAYTVEVYSLQRLY